jgi:hypothetical protein
MSTRLNLCGVSLPRMRSLLGSGDEAALDRLREQAAERGRHWREDERARLLEILERAVRQGVPFRDVVRESYLHTRASQILLADGQEWLYTHCDYHATALPDLMRRYGRHAAPEGRALLRGLAEGVPLFGQNPPAEAPYAIIGLEKLRALRPGLSDFQAQVDHRAGRDGVPEAAKFVERLSDWIDEIMDAGRDLFSLVA